MHLGEELEPARKKAELLGIKPQNILLTDEGIPKVTDFGISNIMVFVIKERTKEFGIRQAVGATPSSIIWMVLQESIFITTISGYFGLFVGVVFLSSLGNTLKEDFYITDPYVDLNTALMATIMLIIFGQNKPKSLKQNQAKRRR